MEQNQETVATVAKLAAGLFLFRGGLLAVRLGFNLLGGPLVSAAVKFLTFRSLLAGGIRPMQALFRLFGMSPRAAALFAGGMGRAGGAVRSLGPLLLRAGRFSGGALARGFTQGGKAAAWLGSGILKLGRILSGALVKGFTLAGRAVAVLGRALLFNPVGLLVTGVGVAAYLIYKNWDKVKAAFSAGWEAIRAEFNKGMEWLKQLPTRFLEMGRNMAAGLADGIKSGITSAGDAIAGMAESVKNRFKGWLGIASPSKVFAGYGLNVAQGAALGIKAGEGEAAGAAMGLARAAARGWAAPNMASASSGRQPAPDWQPPQLLTAPDGPARIAAASRSGGQGGFGQAGMTVQFSPSITIQGSATEKDVRGALAMTLPELERMMRRLMHDQQRRAYV